MTALTDFLLQRIAEDEACVIDMDCACTDLTVPDCPDRVLAECEAKRRIVEAISLPDNLIESDAQRVAHIARRLVLGHLASIYADHPDYDEAWKP